MSGCNPIAGTGVFMLGGLAAALYLLPFRWVKGWRYETGWLVSVLVGWVAFPLVFDSLMVPDPLGIVFGSGAMPVVRTMAFGMLWGIGALCWALMVRYLGVGLGLAIGAGICAAAGTLLPPIVTGNAASLVATAGARRVLAGVAVSLFGIVAVGMAGRFKEDEMSEEAKRKAVADYDFRKGVISALIAGFASAGINFALQGAPEWEAAAIGRGASAKWAGMPVLTVALWGGALTQVIWVALKNRKAAPADKQADGNGRWMNFALCSVVGIAGMSQYLFQKVGEPLLGEMRYVSFAVLMASAIFFSTAVGAALGEWRGTGQRTRVTLGIGLAVLLAAFALMSSGS